MVRTKADAGGSSGSRKAVGGNAPRKAFGGAGPSASADSPSGKGNKFAGGNAVCPRPTPEWQKGIGAFLAPRPAGDKENAEPVQTEEESTTAGSSKEGQGTSMEDD